MTSSTISILCTARRVISVALSSLTNHLPVPLIIATDIVTQAQERLAEKMTEQKLKPVLDAVWLTLTNDLPRQTRRQTYEVDSVNRRRHKIHI